MYILTSVGGYAITHHALVIFLRMTSDSFQLEEQIYI